MNYSPLIRELLQSLQCLPSVGPKSAQRMAFHLLERSRDSGLRLAKILELAMQNVKNCKRCRMLCETDLCSICNDATRDENILCVVESPVDVVALEQAGGFKGRYFVLMGCLSPIDGIGPKDLGVDLYKTILESGAVKEVILATGSTVEGDTTAYFLAELAESYKIKTSRIAHGVPVGGELEHLDGRTLSRAISNRTIIA